MPLVDAGSLTSAALISAATRAVSSAPPITELESSTIGDSALASWERSSSAAAVSPADPSSDASDGRWFWMAALALLALETLLRRARPRQVAPELRHDRAA